MKKDVTGKYIFNFGYVKNILGLTFFSKNLVTSAVTGSTKM